MTGHRRYTHLGRTLDDAAGEAFDKGARLLGLGYPGGPAIQKAAAAGKADAFALPRAWLGESNDFSFSGLKTAVLTLVRSRPVDEACRADIAAEFQAAVVDVLTAKSLAALEQTGLRQLVVAGGVGANRRLRARLDQAAADRKLNVYYPPIELCTDNGAMIALAAALRLQRSPSPAALASIAFSVRPRWDLEELGG
jgi:N6-L-threonylcarbamoyladenine synthase